MGIMSENTNTNSVTGRPTKCTPELMAEIEGYILAGNYISTAVQAAGIQRSTFYNWLKWGEEAAQKGEENIYREFLERTATAFAKAEVALVEMAKDPKNRNWAACITILERTRNSTWSARQEVHVTHELKAPGLPPAARSHQEWLEHRAAEQRLLEARDAEFTEVSTDRC